MAPNSSHHNGVRTAGADVEVGYAVQRGSSVSHGGSRDDKSRGSETTYITGSIIRKVQSTIRLLCQILDNRLSLGQIFGINKVG